MTQNNPARAAFLSIAKEVKAHGSRMDKLVQPLLAIEGFALADIKGGGKYFPDLTDAVAQAYLTPAQYATWADTTLATSIKGEKTERGRLMQAVSPRVAKVRDAIAKAMASETEGGKRGPAQKRTATQKFFDDMDTYVKRFSKEGASDDFDFDPILARQHLVAMVKVLK